MDSESNLKACHSLSTLTLCGRVSLQRSSSSPGGEGESSLSEPSLRLALVASRGGGLGGGALRSVFP